MIDMANSQGHVITNVDSLYKFSKMVRIPPHLSFGKHKGEAIADLANHSDEAGYIKWLLKQYSIDPRLSQAYQQALESV